MLSPGEPFQAFSLAGRVAVVTGAAGLLGQQHCRALAEAGATVVATDLGAEACKEVARAVSALGRGPAHGVAADITVRASVEGLRDATLRLGDRIDVIVNNAAVNDRFVDRFVDRSADRSADRFADRLVSVEEQSRFENYDLERFRQTLEVNVTGTFLVSQVLGAEMARRRGGSIINIASTYGLVGPDQRLYRRSDGTQEFWKSAAYPASKGAVLAFTRFLATYWAERGVRVNSLSPGGVAQAGQTEDFVAQYAARTPLGRMAGAHELGGAIVFLASDASSYMTGANLVVDGGWTAW